MPPPEPIRTVGRYDLLRRIARGGMGEIYLARAGGTAGFEKRCIIKTILPHLFEREDFRTMFLDEGRILVQLVHGNIVPVFDMFDDDEGVYIAMEYIPGRDLREVARRLRERGETMPVDLAMFVTSEACKGLHYAHRKAGEDGEPLGIIHRDVSPSNILISAEGEVKLIDFGIARAANRLSETESGRIQGKFCYMSPEQVTASELDARSDVFSAALVLYELITGFRPFDGGGDLESLDLVRKCEVDPPDMLNPSVPDEVVELVMRALSAERADRPKSAGAFQVSIMQYLYSHGSSPTSTELAEFLAELFPEGLEREELKATRTPKKPQPKKNMSLDEALEFELEQMEAGTPSTREVDPHETTAISSEEALRQGAQTEDPEAALAAVPPEVTPTSTPVPTGEMPRQSRGPWLAVALLAIVGVLAFIQLRDGDNAAATSPPTAAAAANVDQPQSFMLRATPVNAELWLDGAPLGAPVVTLQSGEVATIVARADGCKPLTKQIEYGSANSGVSFNLVCEAADPAPQLEEETVVAVAPPEEEPEPKPKPKPVRRSLRPKEPAPTGCVQMSIINPFIADWFLDGKPLGKSRGTRQETAAGSHRVRVVNNAAGLDHRTTIDVEPGDKCAKLLLDGATL